MPFITSLLLTVGMGAVFVLFSLIALNGYMSMEAAMPTYLVFNCFAWPVMVGITMLATWGVMALANKKRPLRQLALLNTAVVTTFLAIAALLLYFG
ncbi:MAG: hypothetical protein IPM39_24050 [Chloroflexi bacterium]|nr:hypothetical protein [Chloroflexota bacterium]